MKTTLNTSAPQTALATSSVTAPRRGVKKPEAMSLVSTFAFPTTAFTIKEAVHAIGIDHRRYLKAEDGAAGVAALRAVKKSLDPSGLMNPGKLL